MDILFFTQWFDPEPFVMGSPFTAALEARGHGVELLTGFPNDPDNQIYAGYRIRPVQREVLGGTTIIRVPLYPSHDLSSRSARRETSPQPPVDP